MLLVLLTFAASAATLLLLILLFLRLRRSRRWRRLRMLFQPLDFFPNLFQICSGGFISRIQLQRRFIMRRGIGEVLQGLVVLLIEVRAVLQRPPEIEVTVLLQLFIG